MRTEYRVHVIGVVFPVRFPFEDGEQMILAGERARECAADLAESLGANAYVWLDHEETIGIVDSRLAGNPSHWPYRDWGASYA